MRHALRIHFPDFMHVAGLALPFRHFRCCTQGKGNILSFERERPCVRIPVEVTWPLSLQAICDQKGWNRKQKCRPAPCGRACAFALRVDFWRTLMMAHVMAEAYMCWCPCRSWSASWMRWRSSADDDLDDLEDKEDNLELLRELRLRTSCYDWIAI